MNTKPFPWNPDGFINPRIEHLFKIGKKFHHRAELPTYLRTDVTAITQRTPNHYDHANTGEIAA